jgi:DNA-binding CsgD family transcriptional regulator
MTHSLEDKIKDLQKVADLIPGVVIVNNMETLFVEFMSSNGLRDLKTTMADLQTLGSDYVKVYFNEADAEDYVPKIIALMEGGNEDEVITFFQQVRLSPKSDWVWHLSSTRIFHKNEIGKPTHIITIACPVDPDHHITAKVNRLLDERNFLIKNQDTYASLTKQERVILVLIAQGKSSIEIADELHISEETVNTHRKKIRAKINAKTPYDITRFAQIFNLI